MILRDAVNQQMNKDVFVRKNRGFVYDYFIKDLLDEKLAIGYENIHYMDYIRTNFSNRLYCMIIETARSTEIVNSMHIQKLFENTFPDTKSLFYNEQIILLFQIANHSFFQEKDFQTIKQLCMEHGLYAGISNCFFDILNLREFYKQALHAVEMGVVCTDGPDLFRYQDFYLRHTMTVFNQKEKLQTFSHPKLLLLFKYDEEHHTQLSKTLYTYLLLERNLASASRELDVHRNTLSSRLKQIESIVPINYEDSAERQYLILSYEFCQLYKKEA